MHKQLFRLYLLIIVIVMIMLYLFTGIYNQVVKQEDSYQVSVDALIDLATNDQLPLLTPIKKDSLKLPKDLAQKLEKNHAIAVKVSNDELLFFKKIEGKLYSYGPINQITSINVNDERLIQLSFFIALALAFLVILIPIARDIATIRRAAKSFARKPKTLLIDVKKKSMVFPIAQGMEAMSKQIVELMKIQQDLAMTVAHEIRTPLSRLKFVHKQIEPLITEKNSSRILKDIEEINTLASDYLTYSKLDTHSNKLDTEMRPLADIAELIQEKFEIYQRKIDINVKLNNTNARYNLQEMSIAIQNLIMNAMRYAKSTIMIEISSNQENAFIKVMDDGKGISGKRGAIIKQFNRKARDKHDFGFGLGLYITNLIALKHKGMLSIDNESELGGANFTITWPKLNSTSSDDMPDFS